ncbi:MAG: hypothetical protein ACRDL8_10725, partial [Solirubrobacteraceae bacterium]
LSSRAGLHHGWYRTPVTVTFACVAGSAPLAAACPSPVRLARSARNQSAGATVDAADGGSATVSLRGIDIDRDRPVVRVTGARPGRVYRARRRLRCVAHDVLSGVASCRIKQRVGTPHGNPQVRVVRYTATATDHAGNTRKVTGSYRIRR